MKRLVIRVGEVKITARLRETPTAAAIYDAAPFTSFANTWGEEVYFDTPARAQLEADAKDVVDPGELAFWVQGNSIAIGFGPTPISQGNEIRLAARTNIWADAEDSVRQLLSAKDGDKVTVEPV